MIYAVFLRIRRQRVLFFDHDHTGSGFHCGVELSRKVPCVVSGRSAAHPNFLWRGVSLSPYFLSEGKGFFDDGSISDSRAGIRLSDGTYDQILFYMKMR